MTCPVLYPNHRHQWINHPVTPGLVRCAVCGFTVPRNLVQLEGEPAQPKERT